ncbi:hypothetical protein M9Y10_034254 [Tritrichomonas musculus]|uniref:Uncharacterized protein n=1 Tax=Tritrichomonas musculus TaxID=1915356 RepID=A0ABR2KHK0_9EUKA
MAPLLAGVLIFGLVYLISLSSTISQYVTSLPEKVGITVIKKSIKFVFTQLLQTYLKGQLEAFCNKIIEFLNKKFDQQIQIISTFSTKLARYLRVLASIINPKNDFTLIERKIRSMFEDKVQFKSSFAESFVTQGLPIKHFIKIGIMIMMCFAAFLFIFNNQKKAIKNKKSQANTGNQKSSNNSTNPNANANNNTNTNANANTSTNPNANSNNNTNTNTTNTNTNTTNNTNNANPNNTNTDINNANNDSSNNTNSENETNSKNESIQLHSDKAESKESKVAKSFDKNFSDDDKLNKLLKKNSDIYQEKDKISDD